MKKFDLIISGPYPLSKLVEADSLQDAFNKVKNSIVQDSADWDMYPIFEGEKRVSTSFKDSGKKFRVTLFNQEFNNKQKNQNIEVDTDNQIHRLVKCSDCDATKWADATGTQCFMCWSEGFSD